jgi:hypothetical protein
MYGVPAKAQGKNIKRTGPIKAAGKEEPKQEAAKGGKKAAAGKGGKKSSSGKTAVKKKSPTPPRGIEGDISVIIYNTAVGHGGANHWSLFYRTNGNRGMISEAAGTPGHMRYQEHEDADPRHSHRFAQEIQIAYIDDYDFYMDCVRTTPIRNETHPWNCQNWVIEALEGLQIMNMLTLAEYEEAEETLRARMDPV